MSHSGTESAVVLQCLMLLDAFLTPLGRGFIDFFSPFGRDFRDFFTPLGVDKCWTIVSFSSSCTDRGVSLVVGLNRWLLFAG